MRWFGALLLVLFLIATTIGCGEEEEGPATPSPTVTPPIQAEAGRTATEIATSPPGGMPDCDQRTLWAGPDYAPSPPDPSRGALTTLRVAPDPVARGEKVQATYYTTRVEHCEIDVGYPVSAADRANLGPQTIDQSGQVSWIWQIPTDATPGVKELTVSCECRLKQYGAVEELSGGVITVTYEIR